MKKRIVTILCTAVLTLALAAAPAIASDVPFRPIEVESYTYGPLDELRISKVYQLSQHDDPSGIPTEDFVSGNRRYYLLEITADNTDPEVVTYTAAFGSVKLTGDEMFAKAPGQSGVQAMFADLAEKGNDPDLLPFWICVGCLAMAAAIKLCAINSKQKEKST